MNEHFISRHAVVTTVLWTVSVGLLISAWMVVIVSPPRLVHTGVLLGLTAVVFGAMAATAQCVQVGIKICTLIRASTERVVLTSDLKNNLTRVR